MSDGLFPENGLRVAPAPPEVDDRTDGQKLRDRQAARIARGYHPLGEPLRLHPYAPRVLADDRGGKEPYRCGTCSFRASAGGHARQFPKCWFGYSETPIPEAQQTKYGPKVRVEHPRATRSNTSDVRAWWPACVDYSPGDNAMSRDAARYIPEEEPDAGR